MTNLHQSFVDKLFGKNKMGLLVPKLQESLEKKILSGLRVVTARLLITEQHSDIFLLERLSTWEFRIKREKVLETLKSQ